jgi:hypothetical protein
MEVRRMRARVRVRKARHASLRRAGVAQADQVATTARRRASLRRGAARQRRDSGTCGTLSFAFARQACVARASLGGRRRRQAALVGGAQLQHGGVRGWRALRRRRRALFRRESGPSQKVELRESAHGHNRRQVAACGATQRRRWTARARAGAGKAGGRGTHRERRRVLRAVAARRARRAAVRIRGAAVAGVVRVGRMSGQLARVRRGDAAAQRAHRARAEQPGVRARPGARVRDEERMGAKVGGRTRRPRSHACVPTTKEDKWRVRGASREPAALGVAVGGYGAVRPRVRCGACGAVRAVPARAAATRVAPPRACGRVNKSTRAHAQERAGRALVAG